VVARGVPGDRKVSMRRWLVGVAVNAPSGSTGEGTGARLTERTTPVRQARRDAGMHIARTLSGAR